MPNLPHEVHEAKLNQKYQQLHVKRETLQNTPNSTAAIAKIDEQMLRIRSGNPSGWISNHSSAVFILSSIRDARAQQQVGMNQYYQRAA